MPIGKGAKDVRGVLEAPRAVDLNERRLIMNDRRKQSSPGLRNGISRAITPFAFADDGRGIGQGIATMAGIEPSSFDFGYACHRDG